MDLSPAISWSVFVAPTPSGPFTPLPTHDSAPFTLPRPPAGFAVTTAPLDLTSVPPGASIRLVRRTDPLFAASVVLRVAPEDPDVPLADISPLSPAEAEGIVERSRAFATRTDVLRLEFIGDSLTSGYGMLPSKSQATGVPLLPPHPCRRLSRLRLPLCSPARLRARLRDR
eukprot:gnl/Ergobibamus_cyprinoides/1080.p2 GENE.gnl/Ergobibamus_cyprinoides/1080~~gnl/Ergobibamus_cyprinoides/1080.p2  ORF type:complete len:181 (-),score=14.51 gnl/Ergobibamus_cyprinoides/1080:930-1442(-)